jgi:hypothetical protein
MSAIKFKRPLAILLVYYLSVLSTSLSAWSSLDYTDYQDESSWYCTAVRVIDEHKQQDEAEQNEEEEEPDCD